MTEIDNMVDDIKMSVKALNSRITAIEQSLRSSKKRRRKPLGNKRR